MAGRRKLQVGRPSAPTRPRTQPATRGLIGRIWSLRNCFYPNDCLTSVAIEPAIGASAIRPENREIVGRRYCPDERLGWLAPKLPLRTGYTPADLATVPQASA